MEKNIEEIIMERITGPGWVATRGVVRDPRAPSSSELEEAEQAMKSLAERGLVTLWRLILEQDGSQMMAASRPGMQLDKELEERGAWARAEPY